MIKDGKYDVYRFFNGTAEKIGCFNVKDDSIFFDDQCHELNLDMIPAGKMSERTKELIESFLNKQHNHYIIIPQDEISVPSNESATWDSEKIAKSDKTAFDKLYHIYNQGYKITTTPMKLEHINKLYGEVPKLESMGFRLIPQEETPISKPKVQFSNKPKITNKK